MIPVKHFYMIRHGETEANAAQVMAGSLDSPLTPKGREQARSLQRIVETLSIKPQEIVHSPLSRARDTAEIINETLGLPMHEDPDYAEMHAGDWEGRPYTECHAIFTDWIDAPNGETCAAFFDRVRRAKKSALEHRSSPPLIVCHGGVFRAFWKLYGIQSHGVQNCKLYEFTPSDISGSFPWQVWRYNLTENKIERTAVQFSSDNPDSEIR